MLLKYSAVLFVCLKTKATKDTLGQIEKFGGDFCIQSACYMPETCMCWCFQGSGLLLPKLAYAYGFIAGEGPRK